MRVDILPREAQRQEATGDKPAIAPSVKVELVLVAVVGVAVKLHDHPPLDHQIHLANALDLHPVLEAQPRGLKVDSRQSLQGRTRPVTNLLGSDTLIVKCRVKSDERRVVLNVAAQKTSQGLRKWLHRV